MVEYARTPYLEHPEIDHVATERATEPVVRLNVESRGDVDLMQAKTQEVLEILEA